MSFFVVKSPHTHGGWNFSVGEVTAVCHMQLDAAGPASGAGLVYGQWLGSYHYDRESQSLGERIGRVKVIERGKTKRKVVDAATIGIP